MLRLILGILAGFITAAILSMAADEVCHMAGILPPYGVPFFETGPYLLATFYRAVFQVSGAYLAAVIAKEKAKAAIWTIGIVGTLLWLTGLSTAKDIGPLWYPILGAVLSIPTVLAGYSLYKSRLARQTGNK